ncbi:tyrosine-type recombinase/integrase [Roseateles sp. SL47]|uniref:tyrosine-type recombinase/integrase n=1 Tax=Roseateles sp. SL47 TaxID=2995138 RepID=UPI00226F1781|nr:tyrosine-type recombinase/integrase [Roseateles sp. SL47]WAC72112.1 tyrosine-type recombinase/integrase [Roseateles sp. SL47]
MARARDKHSQITLGLLPRMEARPRKNGFTFRYHPVGGKPINLGHDRIKALRRVLDLTGQLDETGTLKWVWERFTDDDRPSPRWKKLSEGTRKDYALAWKEISKTFGKMLISQIDAPMVARYVHIERASSPRRADIEKTVLSNLFKYGITLGVCKLNATIGVEPHGSEPRTARPLDQVLKRFLAWLDEQTPQRRIIGMAAEFSSLAGNRQVEFRPLTWPQIDRAKGEIRTFRAKQRGKRREQIVEVISITTAMGRLLDRLEAVRVDRECLYVFPTRDRNQYTARGFQTLWNRSVHAAMEAGALKPEDRFTFHDLRAYYVTVHKQQTGDLPDIHKNKATTARVYDRNTEVPRSSLK